MAGLGRLLAWAWVGSACAGWLPGVWVVVAQAWWWLATSCVVLVVALMWPPRVALREAGWGLLLLLVGVAGWIPRMPGTVTWSCQPLLWMLAGVAVVERWGWRSPPSGRQDGGHGRWQASASPRAASVGCSPSCVSCRSNGGTR